MADATITFHVEDALKDAFVEAAKAQDRTGEQLLREFVWETVARRDHDTWFRAEVRLGVDDADGRRFPRRSHAEVMDSMKERLENRIAQAARDAD